MGKPSSKGNVSPDDPIRVPEQLLIEAIGDFPAQRVLATSLGRGQLARRYAAHFPDSEVTCLFLDIYLSRRAETATETRLPNLQILCAADPPEEEFDLALFPLTQGGEAELTRDLMQSAYQQLKPGGQLVVSIDNPRDTWLHEEMQRLFPKVTCKAGKGGLVYSGTKREPLKKLKNFRAEFKFRDREQLISVETRPGVFSHRRLDLGARAILDSLEISAGQRVLDMGCGAGVLSLAAALRDENVHVLSVDSNIRAVECTQQNASLNGISTITTLLNASAQFEEQHTFDIVLANPPYYSNYRIAEIFLKGARRALKPGGEVLVVAKASEWYEETMPRQFDNVQLQNVRGYHIIRGVQRTEISGPRSGKRSNF